MQLSWLSRLSLVFKFSLRLRSGVLKMASECPFRKRATAGFMPETAT